MDGIISNRVDLCDENNLQIVQSLSNSDLMRMITSNSGSCNSKILEVFVINIFFTEYSLEQLISNVPKSTLMTTFCDLYILDIIIVNFAPNFSFIATLCSEK